MTSNPKISIVIPVYNGSDYLKEAINSALGQTSTDFEVIVVNDGSNDGGKTEAIAKSYEDKIRYFYKENGGVASALNLGIKNMKGEWFAWLSHDDIFAPNRIEEDLKFLESNPEAKVIFCKIKRIDSQGNFIEDVNYSIQKVTNCREAVLLGGVDMCALTIHKSCFEKTGLFKESNLTMQDVEMGFRLVTITPFYLNSNTVTFKREHLNRGSYTMSERHKQDSLAFCDFIHNELTLDNFFPSLNYQDENEVFLAWIYMEILYQGFGAIHYAQEARRLAFFSYKSNLRRSIKRLIFAFNKLKSPVMNRLIQKLHLFYKKMKP